ncbi:MAG: capsule assembly Wzi family protein [candidate division Zixibacteria bacterium]
MVVLALLLFIQVKALHSQNVYISTSDPVNAGIEELLARGYLHGLSPAEKPWKVSEIVNGIRDDEQRFDDHSRIIAGDILRILKPPQRKLRASAGLEAGIDIRGLSSERREGYFIRRGRYIPRGFKNEFGSVYRAGWWYSRDDLWGIDTRLLIDSDGTDYPWYYGRPRNARIIVQFDHAYAAFKLGMFDITLGRQRMIRGPSPRGSLILDDGSPPMDMARFGVRVAPFRLSWFGARLDDTFNPDIVSYERRYLSGHRLSLNNGSGWELGVSETVLYGGAERLPEIYYNIPVLLYYWEAHNHIVDDNVFWTVDFSWAKSGLGRFYTQFVADDIQYENNGPQKFAFQIGSYLMPNKYPKWSALIEYNMADTYVYGQRQWRNLYRHWGYPIARLGSDQYEIFAGIYRHLISNIKTGVEYNRRGKGEYNSDMLQVDIIPPTPKFPSGIVEVIDDIRITFKHNSPERLDFNFSAGYQTINNYRNISDSSLSQYYATIDISYTFGMGLPFWMKYH